MNIKMNINKVALTIVILFVIAGVLIVVLDWKEMRLVFGRANWLLLLPPILFTASSYACLSYSLSLIFRIFGINMNFKYLMQIGFVSNVVTYMMNVGGITGVSLELILLKKRGLATEDILAPSLFQLYFSSLVLIALLPIGLFNILATHPLSRVGSFIIIIASCLLILLLVLAGIIVFNSPFRSAVLRRLSRTVRLITRRNITPIFDNFDMAMKRGVAVLHQPRWLTLLVLLTIMDWASTVTALWFCFYALGSSISLGKLLTGFSLGITAGFISFVPGGLGVQEGSMAGIYALLGEPIQTAIFAAILFRIIYYFLPFAVSLGFYRRLLRTV